jgi:hypothetical protein
VQQICGFIIIAVVDIEVSYKANLYILICWGNPTILFPTDVQLLSNPNNLRTTQINSANLTSTQWYDPTASAYVTHMTISLWWSSPLQKLRRQVDLLIKTFLCPCYKSLQQTFKDQSLYWSNLSSSLSQ